MEPAQRQTPPFINCLLVLGWLTTRLWPIAYIIVFTFTAQGIFFPKGSGYENAMYLLMLLMTWLIMKKRDVFYESLRVIADDEQKRPIRKGWDILKILVGIFVLGFPMFITLPPFAAVKIYEFEPAAAIVLFCVIAGLPVFAFWGGDN